MSAEAPRPSCAGQWAYRAERGDDGPGTRSKEGAVVLERMSRVPRGRRLGVHVRKHGEDYRGKSRRFAVCIMM